MGVVGVVLFVSCVCLIYKWIVDNGVGCLGWGGRGEWGGDVVYEKRNVGVVEFMMIVVDVGDVYMKKRISCYVYNI